MKLALLVASFAFSAAAFLILDGLRTAAVHRSQRLRGNASDCEVRDSVRHHALKPNCTSVHHWGADSWSFFTNSLGFRDEKIRQVQLSDPRPRILMLGDSFTEGMIAWRDSYAGKIAAHFPQFDFLNGGVASYSPSNYLNTTRMVLAAGVEIDEAIVFIDISDVQDEAAFYRDLDASGTVSRLERPSLNISWYSRFRHLISERLLFTDYLFRFCERFLVRRGYYHLTVWPTGNQFDMPRSAWTYRKVDETAPAETGYAPLGVEGGIAKEKEKMTQLWHELQEQNVPLSVVVYPWPAQVVHDTADSRQVRIWRDWCTDKCKRFISLFSAFLTVKDQCPRSQHGCWYESHFVFGDFHYNSTGNALVADEVIKSLVKTPPAKRLPAISGGVRSHASSSMIGAFGGLLGADFDREHARSGCFEARCTSAGPG